MSDSRERSLFQWVVGGALIAASVALVVMVAAPERAPEPAIAEAEIAQKAMDEETELPRVVEARLARLTKNMWWHQDEMRDTLALSDEQARRMDELCLGFLRDRWRRRQAAAQQQGAFGRALERLNLEAAERVLDIRERRAAEQVVAGDRLVLAVLRELTPEQLEVAQEELPSLFKQPWLKGLQGSMAERPRRRASGGAGESAGSPTASSGDPGGG